MNSITETILNVARMPEMFLIKNELSCLNAYLLGWTLRDPQGVIDKEMQAAFEDEIVNSYSLSKHCSFANAYSLILMSTRGEESALELYFEKHKDFIAIYKNATNVMSERKESDVSSFLKGRSIFEIVFEVRKRPGLYFGGKSIFSLYSFISGWIDRDKNGIEDMNTWKEFEQWLIQSYNLGVEASWADLIRISSPSNETAMDSFFYSYDLWKKGG